INAKRKASAAPLLLPWTRGANPVFLSSIPSTISVSHIYLPILVSAGLDTNHRVKEPTTPKSSLYLCNCREDHRTKCPVIEITGDDLLLLGQTFPVTEGNSCCKRQSPAETTGTPKSSYELWHYTLFCEIEAGKAKVALGLLLCSSGCVIQILIHDLSAEVKKRLASMAKEEEKDNE
ncbi:unnamed protein product, partial [Fusarium graminearum]